MSVEDKVKGATGMGWKMILAVCVLIVTVPMAVAWAVGKWKSRTTTAPGA